MNAYCPECETELDQATGICPACRWNPLMATANQPLQVDVPQQSLTERYRGTEFEAQWHAAVVEPKSVSRGRAFVVIGLLAGAGLYGIVLGFLGAI